MEAALVHPNECKVQGKMWVTSWKKSPIALTYSRIVEGTDGQGAADIRIHEESGVEKIVVLGYQKEMHFVSIITEKG